MRRASLALVLLLASASPAAAYDPDARRGDAAVDGGPPVQLPPGLYRVTEVYTGDVVTRSGDLTRYETTTTHRMTDTYARALETVATGTRSAFDGSSFNGRAALSDGAFVAGTYYQNFVVDGRGYRPVSIVFFQDDLEIARHLRSTSTPRPSSAPTPPPAPAPTTTPSFISPIPTRTTPSFISPVPMPARTLGPVTIGVDPTGGAALLRSLEVARGARYGLRVNVRGEASLDAWMLAGGTNDAANAAGWHPAAAPLQALWLRLPPPGATWTLALRVRLAPAWGGAPVERDATIDIAVRSPAVVE